jgi:hypothetical protein
MLVSLLTIRRPRGSLDTTGIPEGRNLPLLIDSNYPCP